jgi:hypothetical protein
LLFGGIDERVESAELVRQEENSLVLAVRYTPSTHAHMIVPGEHILYWVRKDDRLIARQQGRVGHRPPTEHEVAWSSHTVSVETITLNEPIADDVFRFMPPPDATAAPTGGVGSAGGSGGFIERTVDGTNRVENRSSHWWDGDTLVEQSRWKMRGLMLEFERRLSFSDDGQELRVDERIAGPRATVSGSFAVPVGAGSP